MSTSTGWSDDRIATLCKLWLGGLSASQIARQLGGVTRNAVIGKVHRLGLSGRPIAPAPARAVRITPPPRKGPVRPARSVRSTASASLPPPPGWDEPGLIDNLIHLVAHSCKWPIGDPKSYDFTFCGRGCEGRYCARHEALGVRLGTTWHADRDPVGRRALAGLVSRDR